MPNETITGKIYPVWNATKTERRFPQTVIEAVLGLPTYLQDQFSALADIYMPIEGISESETGQEFVYRKSPATIKAKSLTLDRIKGKTLAWNQLVQSGRADKGITATLADGVFSLTGTITNSYSNCVVIDGRMIVGHKYFLRRKLLANPNNLSFYVSLLNQSYVGALGWDDVIIEATSASSNAGVSYATVNTDFAGVKFAMEVLDLTLLYGSEIDGLTDEQILVKFESEFPGYHDFGNKLISNDASAIETVGFNQWDEVWESGSIRSGDGAETSPDGYYRSKDYIRVLPNTTYYIKSPVKMTLLFYDANKNFCGNDYMYWEKKDAEFIVPSVACYVRFRNATANTWTPYSHDICINLSDPAKNGTYEPYRKTTLQLGLKTLTGKKNGTGASTVIFPFGLCGEGDVFDEIIQNKATKRMVALDLTDITWTYNSTYEFFVCNNITANGKTAVIGGIPAICSIYTRSSWSSMVSHDHSKDKVFVVNDSSYYARGIQFQDFSKTGSDLVNGKAPWLNGVYIYYELNEYEEYILDEPLIYSMAAGTTEERVSPNSDGLSAPFCCDMTYDANANNDSANAQYAATAGRLYNTHKLWGQDFDGSNDVSGALSGVTTIGASGNITTAAQLISTVATGTAPLSVASTTEVANLHSYTATKLHTQRTLWGQNFDGSGNVTGNLSSVGNISFSESGKNIASLLYFDTTNSRVGVGASSPAYKLDVNGTLNASGNTTLGGTLDVIGNTTIGGTFTVGTSSVNKATTLYGALTASGAVSFSDTLTIAGLTTFNGNAILPANKTFTIGPSSGTHATLEWDATNSCVKITGNLRVTGWIEQQGTQSNS